MAGAGEGGEPAERPEPKLRATQTSATEPNHQPCCLHSSLGVLRRQNARIQATLEASRLTSQDFQDDLNGVLGEHVAERARLLARINRAVEWGTTWRNNYDRRRDAFNQLLIHFNALEAREYIHSNQTFAAIPDTAPRLDVNSWLREDVPDPRLWGPPGAPVPLFYGYQN